MSRALVAFHDLFLSTSAAVTAWDVFLKLRLLTVAGKQKCDLSGVLTPFHPAPSPRPSFTCQLPFGPAVPSHSRLGLQSTTE
jgi:hypothetical protein